jgi:hypothetical protein
MVSTFKCNRRGLPRFSSEYLLENIIFVERDADEECEEPSEDVLKYEDDYELLRHPRYKSYKM